MDAPATRTAATAPKATPPYFVNEEEVPQTGTGITVAYNRTHCQDGRVALRLATRRSPGRTEASSGPSFDVLTDTDPPAGSTTG
ncbi:hypothetical protein ACIRL2_46400 [Embleya sp. NPDC127516]|uniref:hypothetical protein n=1 Tax=Embleya sp. NPDC127516 TaxID=3363990 RepID=UPI00382922D2